MNLIVKLRLTAIMNGKYLLFSPYYSGLSNVIMSLEIGLSMALATGRSIILPPSVYLHTITTRNKSSWVDPFELFDGIELQTKFNAYSSKNIDEIALLHSSIESETSWFTGIETKLSSSTCLEELPPNRSYDTPVSWDPNLCFVNEPELYKNTTDFSTFVGTRTIVDLNRQEKFIIVNNNAFQHHWYWVYHNGSINRNGVKNKINSALKFNQKFYNLVDQVVTPTLSRFNAVHIRRGDFLNWGAIQVHLQSINTVEKILDQLIKYLDPSIPLYISTNEIDLDFFNPLRDKFKIYFLQDFYTGESLLIKAIMEQIICSRAEKFLGTCPSTFTKRINIMRGIIGNQNNDSIYLNLTIPCNQNPLPWVNTTSQRWLWYNSSHPAWTLE